MSPDFSHEFYFTIARHEHFEFSLLPDFLGCIFSRSGSILSLVKHATSICVRDFFYMANDTKRFSPFNVVIADWFEFSNFHIFNHHFANHFSIFITFFKWWKEDWEKRQKALIQIYGWNLQVIKMLKSWLKNALNLLCAIKDS